MTWSAPSEATRSTFRVLHTPVTSAPNALANCTANVPTPPDAPLIKTLCPGRTCPLSRSACNAVHPATGTDADVFGESSPIIKAAEHLIPGPQPGHVTAHRLDRPGHVSAEPAGAGPGPGQSRQSPDQIRRATHEMPVQRVDRRRPNPDQHLVVTDSGYVHLPQFQDLRRAVPVIANRLHSVPIARSQHGA